MQLQLSSAALLGLLSLLRLGNEKQSLAHGPSSAADVLHRVLMLTQVLPVGAAPRCWAPSAGAGVQHPSAQLPEHDFL